MKIIQACIKITYNAVLKFFKAIKFVLIFILFNNKIILKDFVFLINKSIHLSPNIYKKNVEKKVYA